MKKELWIKRFIELLSRRICKRESKRISQRLGNACAKYAEEHHEEVMKAWNESKESLK